MRSVRRWLEVHYGAGPLHLLCLPAALGFAGYLVWTVLPAPQSVRILIWVVSAAVAHDLLLWPLYSLADRAGHLLSTGRRRPAVPWINHLRVPAVLSAVGLAVSFPLVFRRSEATYHTATGLTEHPYLARWLLLSASAFAVSALLYALRLVVVLRRGGGPGSAAAVTERPVTVDEGEGG
jgi:hypothetical protein